MIQWSYKSNKRKGDMKKKSNKKAKWIVISLMGIVTLVAVSFLAVKFYSWSFNRGYLEGTKNQVLCQAAQKDTTLVNLCK